MIKIQTKVSYVQRKNNDRSVVRLFWRFIFRFYIHCLYSPCRLNCVAFDPNSDRRLVRSARPSATSALQYRTGGGGEDHKKQKKIMREKERERKGIKREREKEEGDR